MAGVLMMQNFGLLTKAALITRGWTITSPVIATTKQHKDFSGRGGDYSMSLYGTIGIYTELFSTTARYGACAVYLAGGQVTPFAMTFRRSGSANYSFSVDRITGIVTLRLGSASGTIQASSTVTVPWNVWNWISWRLVSADAGGVAEFYLNGVLIVSYAGDTKSSATADWDQILIGGDTGDSDWITDLIIGDSTMGHLSEQSIVSLAPTSDRSKTITGAGGFADVDETPSSQADYCEALVAAEQIIFNHAALPFTTPAVLAVCIEAESARDGALTTVNLICADAVTDYGTAQAMAGIGAHVGVSRVLNVDPDTAAAWTSAGVNAAGIGVRYQ